MHIVENAIGWVEYLISYVFGGSVSLGPELLQSVLVAVAIFVVGRWAAKIVSKMASQAMLKAKVDDTLSKFLTRLVYMALLCATTLAALQKLNIPIASFAAILAAAGLAIAMALKDSLSNCASGVMIILFRPFEVGDVIEAAGTKGCVEEIHIFNTIVNSPDNVKTYVPNGSITAGNITNYSREKYRRVDLVVGCGYSDDLRAVKGFLMSLLENHPLVISDPEPMVAVSDLGDNCVNFVVRPWALNKDYWKVRWDLTEQIKLGFDELGFEIPFPQRSVHIFDGVAATESEPAEIEQQEQSNMPVQPRRVA